MRLLFANSLQMMTYVGTEIGENSEWEFEI